MHEYTEEQVSEFAASHPKDSTVRSYLAAKDSCEAAYTGSDASRVVFTPETAGSAIDNDSELAKALNQFSTRQRELWALMEIKGVPYAKRARLGRVVP